MLVRIPCLRFNRESATEEGRHRGEDAGMAVEWNLREHAWEIIDAGVSNALTAQGEKEGLPDVGWALLSDSSPWIEGCVWGHGVEAYRAAQAWMEALGGREAWSGPDRQYEGFWYY